MPLIPSWVESANDATAAFPLNNLPLGVFANGDDDPRCGVAIGDLVLDLRAAEEAGLVELPGGPLMDVPFWNEVMEAGPEVWAGLRGQVRALLAEGAARQEEVRPLLHPLAGVNLYLPFLVSEYTDFYAGRNHALNVGTMFRGAENALP
ncbi:MAG: fumarylacetoacetase, partial [Rhodobacteraceae bacterium]|nr:fumarylacetoacetase [Paracoccaceae bacterium]